MKFYPATEWFIRTDPKIVEIIESLEESNWPIPAQYGQCFKEPTEWYEMPVPHLLEHRISYFGEGDWNEPEMAEEWTAWDQELPAEMANLTLEIKRRYNQIRVWQDNPKTAPRVFQIRLVPSDVDIKKYFAGKDWLHHRTWEEVESIIHDSFGTITTAETLRKEASQFNQKV